MDDRLRKNRLNKPAFTLIELLVVIAIIALLLAVILPSLQKAKDQALLVVCRNNLHQWAVAIRTLAANNNGDPPLSTAYEIDQNGMVTVSFPNEMYLDRYDKQILLGADPRAWQEKMISHEAIAPYLPGFNDLGLRSKNAPFTNQESNFLLKGVWRCPLAKTRDIGLTMGQLRGAYGGNRCFFRLDYAYLGRTDLWADSMFQTNADRGSLVGKHFASGQILITDQIFYWPNTDPDKTYWYNHGKQGPSSEGAVGGSPISSFLKPPKYITGINQAFGDGSVKLKKINSDDRFKEDGFGNQKKNRRAIMGLTGLLYF